MNPLNKKEQQTKSSLTKVYHGCRLVTVALHSKTYVVYWFILFYPLMSNSHETSQQSELQKSSLGPEGQLVNNVVTRNFAKHNVIPATANMKSCT